MRIYDRAHRGQAQAETLFPTGIAPPEEGLKYIAQLFRRYTTAAVNDGYADHPTIKDFSFQADSSLFMLLILGSQGLSWIHLRSLFGRQPGGKQAQHSHYQNIQGHAPRNYSETQMPVIQKKLEDRYGLQRDS